MYCIIKKYVHTRNVQNTKIIKLWHDCSILFLVIQKPMRMPRRVTLSSSWRSKRDKSMISKINCMTLKKSFLTLKTTRNSKSQWTSTKTQCSVSIEIFVRADEGLHIHTCTLVRAIDFLGILKKSSKPWRARWQRPRRRLPSSVLPHRLLPPLRARPASYATTSMRCENESR